MDVYYRLILGWVNFAKKVINFKEKDLGGL